MNKTALLTLLCLLPSALCLAQTPIQKTVSTSGLNKASFQFKYPELIQFNTWDKSEILIKGTVTINNGDHDENFDLLVEKNGDAVIISSEIKDLDKLPKRIVIKKGDVTHYFNTDDKDDPEIKKFMNEQGWKNFSYMSHGVIKEIKLEVFVPKNLELDIFSKYGIVEVESYSGPLTINAKYGAVDIKVPSSARHNLELSTKYGEVYSDMDIEYEKVGELAKVSPTIKGKLNGGGTLLDLESKYGQVYLRKKN